MVTPKKPTPGRPPPPAPRSKVTPELYEEILIWYVQNGTQHIKAAARFGLSRRTMSGLWFTGAKHLNKPPMKLLTQNVEVRARALRAQMKKEELARADAEIQAIIDNTADKSTLARVADDSVRARAEEGAVVASSRRNILQLQEMLSPLLKGAVLRMKELERDIKKMEPDNLVKLMKDLAKFQGDLLSAAKLNMDMERVLLGDPNADKDNRTSLGHKEALQVIEMTARTVERYKSEGKIVESTGEEVPALPIYAQLDDDDEEDEGDEEVDLRGATG